MKVGFVGYDYWCRVAADYLRGSPFEPVMLGPMLSQAGGLAQRIRVLEGPPLREMGIVHAINATWGWRWLCWLRLRGRRIVLHWIGSSDYGRLAGMSGARRRVAMARLSLLRPVHLADSPELAGDLAGLGIGSEVVRLVPPSVSATPSPLPPSPAALTYWSDARADFYGRPVVYALARRWPMIPFRVVGPATNDPDAPPNVECIGYQQDLDPWYRKSSVLIRLPRYDSLSAMVLEAMARGRDVIYSRPFPHARLATDEVSATEAFAQHLQEYRPNTAGAQHVATNFSPERSREQLLEVYARAWP